MPTSVRLDTESEALLKRLARESGRTKSEVIREALHRYAEEQAEMPAQGTVHERLKPWIGIAKGGPANLASEHSRLFREYVRKKHGR